MVQSVVDHRLRDMTFAGPSGCHDPCGFGDCHPRNVGTQIEDRAACQACPNSHGATRDDECRVLDRLVQGTRRFGGIARLLEPGREPVTGRGHDRAAEASDDRSNEAVMLTEDHRPRGVAGARHQPSRVDDVGEHHGSHPPSGHSELADHRRQPFTEHPGQQRRAQSVEGLQRVAPEIQLRLTAVTVGEGMPRAVDIGDRLLEHRARGLGRLLRTFDPEVGRAVAQLDRRLRPSPARC